MTTSQDLGDFSHVPVIDVGPLVKGESGRRDVAEQLGLGKDVKGVVVGRQRRQLSRRRSYAAA